MNPQNLGEVTALQAEALALLMPNMRTLLHFFAPPYPGEGPQIVYQNAKDALARAEALLAPDQPEGEPIAWGRMEYPDDPDWMAVCVGRGTWQLRNTGGCFYTSDYATTPFPNAYPAKIGKVWRWMRPA